MSRFNPSKIIRSLSSRVIFFTILALSVSSLLAGAILILILTVLVNVIAFRLIQSKKSEEG